MQRAREKKDAKALHKTIFKITKNKTMSIQVNCFNIEKAESELKKCPKIVRDYVVLLKENSKRWQQLTNSAISKLKTKSICEHKITTNIFGGEAVYCLDCGETLKK